MMRHPPQRKGRRTRAHQKKSEIWLLLRRICGAKFISRRAGWTGPVRHRSMQLMRPSVNAEMTAAKPPSSSTLLSVNFFEGTDVENMDERMHSGDEFERAFRFVFEAYSTPRDRWETDDGYLLFLREKVTAAFNILQDIRA